MMGGIIESSYCDEYMNKLDLDHASFWKSKHDTQPLRDATD